MYTQCPECLTVFEIDEDALQTSLGIVICGHCSTRFDALRSLSNSLPLDPETPSTNPDVGPRVLTLTTVVSPAELELAARRNRRDEHPKSSTDSADALPAARPDSSIVDVDSGWLANLHTDLTDALIADAAGIAPGDPHGDNTWRVMDAPVQAHFSELDIIPVTPSQFDADEPERDALSGSPTELEPWDADATDLATEVDPDQLEILSVETIDAEASDTAAPPPDGDAELESASDETLPGDRDGFDSAAVDAGEAVASKHDGDEATAVDTTTEGEAEPGTVEPPEPVYIRPRQRHFRRASVLWSLGCLALVVILAVQLAWAKRVALLQDPQTHAWMTRVCGTIDCNLPPIRDIAKLELLSRDIRPDPRTTGALVITATLRNNAGFRQPWPVVTVELSDLDGKPVAMRRFRPAEYIPDASRRAAGIAAGATAAVAFEVADPGKNAMNFQFSFQ
jgi:predicted Zn finger-like uncharacterized protein